MFGPLFYTKQRPKGPNTKRLEQLRFDLSGNQLSLALPYSNKADYLLRQGSIITKTNLYNRDDFEQFDDAWYSTRIILERSFDYSCFSDPGLAFFQFKIILYKLDDVESNLFMADELQKEIYGVFLS